MNLPNRSKVTSPAAFFISLCQKVNKGESILPEIESESDRLMKAMVEKMKEHTRTKQKVEDEALDLAFEDWMSSMTHRSRLEVVPGLKIVGEGTEPYTQACKSFYRANLWPEKKLELLNDLKENSVEV